MFYQLNFKRLKQPDSHHFIYLFIFSSPLRDFCDPALHRLSFLNYFPLKAVQPFARDPCSLGEEQPFSLLAATTRLLLGSEPQRAAHGKAITSPHVHTTCLPWAIPTVTQHQGTAERLKQAH